MDTTIIVAIIGGVSLIIAAMITATATNLDKIVALFNHLPKIEGSSSRKKLAGIWRGTSQQLRLDVENEKSVMRFFNVYMVLKSWGRYVWGTITTSDGDDRKRVLKLRGQLLTDDFIMIDYKLHSARKQAGVLLLHVNGIDFDGMEGYFLSKKADQNEIMFGTFKVKKD